MTTNSISLPGVLGVALLAVLVGCQRITPVNVDSSEPVGHDDVFIDRARSWTEPAFLVITEQGEELIEPEPYIRYSLPTSVRIRNAGAFIFLDSITFHGDGHIFYAGNVPYAFFIYVDMNDSFQLLTARFGGGRTPLTASIGVLLQHPGEIQRAHIRYEAVYTDLADAFAIEELGGAIRQPSVDEELYFRTNGFETSFDLAEGRVFRIQADPGSNRLMIERMPFELPEEGDMELFGSLIVSDVQSILGIVNWWNQQSDRPIEFTPAEETLLDLEWRTPQ